MKGSDVIELSILNLSGNQLSGTILTSLCNLTNRIELYLNNNGFTGLPQSVIDLTNSGHLLCKGTYMQIYNKTLPDMAIINEDFTLPALPVYE